jgi:phage/conjugal plasmid C-4 type zinc finger TraR family protein
MADEADYASEREEIERQEALARMAQQAARHPAPREIQGRRVCADCLAPIGRKRLKANPDAVRCVDCQSEEDRNAKRH